MSRGRVPKPLLHVVGTAVAFFFGGLFTVSLASSIAMRSLQSILEAKRRKVALPCGACKGKTSTDASCAKGNVSAQPVMETKYRDA